MQIKWYGLAEWLGLLEYIEGADGDTAIRVSARCDEFFDAIALTLLALFLIACFLCVFILAKKRRKAAIILPLIACGCFVLRGILQLSGLWIDIRFYPSSVGFIDLSEVGYILEMILLPILTLAASALAFLARRIIDGYSAYKKKIEK